MFYASVIAVSASSSISSITNQDILLSSPLSIVSLLSTMTTIYCLLQHPFGGHGFWKDYVATWISLPSAMSCTLSLQGSWALVGHAK